MSRIVDPDFDDYHMPGDGPRERQYPDDDFIDEYDEDEDQDFIHFD